MELAVVFNELSLRHYAASRDEARSWMQSFVETLTAANDLGLQTLRTHAEFREIVLLPEYPIVAWFNDDSVPIETRDYLLTYATRFPVVRPFTVDLDQEHPIRKREKRGFSAAYHGAEALGLGYAYALDGIGLSILSEVDWDNSEIKIECLEEFEGDLLDEFVSVKHTARQEHLNTHRAWISDGLHALVTDGSSLLKYAKLLYPNIVFCARAIAQVERLGTNHYYFGMLRNEIENMQRYCQSWTTDHFDSSEFGGRTNRESEATLNQFGHSRRFFIPGKGSHVFTWHTRLDRDWRIHFFPVPTERRIYIGYVGEHLRTATS